jgi:hypothetical protein
MLPQTEIDRIEKEVETAIDAIKSDAIYFVEDYAGGSEAHYSHSSIRETFRHLTTAEASRWIEKLKNRKPERLTDGEGYFVDFVIGETYYAVEVHDDGEIIFIKREGKKSVITEVSYVAKLKEENARLRERNLEAMDLLEQARPVWAGGNKRSADWNERVNKFLTHKEG